MLISEKAEILAKWLNKSGVFYATLDFIAEDDYYAIDLLDSTRTGYAGFCYSGKDTLVAFKMPFSEKVASWFPDATIKQVAREIAQVLDDQSKWSFCNGDIFFLPPINGRVGIDLHNFSWERIAIELDLGGEDNGQR